MRRISPCSVVERKRKQPEASPDRPATTTAPLDATTTDEKSSTPAAAAAAAAGGSEPTVVNVDAASATPIRRDTQAWDVNSVPKETLEERRLASLAAASKHDDESKMSARERYLARKRAKKSE